jgi:hypothetical protein
MPSMTDAEAEERRRLLETEIERRLAERFAALRDEFDRLRLEADRRWFGFLERFDQDLKGVVPGELLPTGESAAPGAPRPPGAVSIGAARGLDQAATQVDVLHRFLDECRRYCSRAALLVARGGAIGAWKAVGFTAHGADDDAVRQISMPLTDGGLLSKVMTGNAMRLPASNEISTLLRASKVSDAIVIPMVVREKISGALYADAVLGEEEIFDAEALGFLTFLTGLVVDRLAARKLKPAPALRLPEAVKKPEPAGMWMNEEAAVEELPQSAEVGIETGPAAGAAAPSEGPRPHFSEPDAAPAPPIEAPKSGSFPPPSFTAPSGSFSAPTGSFASPAASVPDVSEGPRRLSGPLSQPVGDERREEARRFARLLVSEIKLYNERAVLEGRERGNLYQRLKEDIDRSRQMYDERIPEDVRVSSDFFQEELVRILADGRPEALGI